MSAQVPTVCLHYRTTENEDRESLRDKQLNPVIDESN